MPADGAARSCAAAIIKITSVMCDTRRLIFTSAWMLTAALAGAAAMVTTLLGHGKIVVLGSSLALLVPVVLSWLVTAVFLILAERPVADAFGELRREIGAPVDLTAPWAPLGVIPLDASDLQWDHVVPLIAAATLQYSRARLVLSWSVITTAGFLTWMVLVIVAVA